MTLKYSKASGECLSPEVLILKRNGQGGMYFLHYIEIIIYYIVKLLMKPNQ